MEHRAKRVAIRIKNEKKRQFEDKIKNNRRNAHKKETHGGYNTEPHSRNDIYARQRTVYNI